MNELKGKVTVERHDLADAIVDIMLNNELTFDEAEAVLLLIRRRLGGLQIKGHLSGN